jgi:hypothetical protein
MVEMLFPLTSPVSTVPDWSIDGILSHVNIFNLNPRVCDSFYPYLQFPNFLFIVVVVLLFYSFLYAY